MEKTGRSIIRCRKCGCIIAVTICPVCNDDNSSYLTKCKREGVSELPYIQADSLTCGFRTEMSSVITQEDVRV